MKPVTNMLLITALICYVFLPFYSMELTGCITGLKYTSGLITENFSILRTLFALVPFLACFGAIVFNCMKNRYWGLVAGFFIIGGLLFYILTAHPVNFPLLHDPDVMPGDPQEGIPVKGLASGYYVSYAFLWLSLVSCIVSLMPFKFNTVLERSIDETFEKVGHEIHDELNRFEGKTCFKKSKSAPEPPSAIEQTGEQPRKEENWADYMPPGSTDGE